MKGKRIKIISLIAFAIIIGIIATICLGDNEYFYYAIIPIIIIIMGCKYEK